MDDTVTVTLSRKQYEWVKNIARHEWNKYCEILDEGGEEAVKHCRNLARMAESMLELQTNP